MQVQKPATTRRVGYPRLGQRQQPQQRQQQTARAEDALAVAAAASRLKMPAGIGAVCVIIKKETAKQKQRERRGGGRRATKRSRYKLCESVCVCDETPAEVREPTRVDADAANIFACMQNGPSSAQWSVKSKVAPKCFYNSK